MTGKEIVAAWFNSGEDLEKAVFANLILRIDAALAAEREEEREACADTIHETLKFQSCMCCQRAIYAIRAGVTP